MHVHRGAKELSREKPPENGLAARYFRSSFIQPMFMEHSLNVKDWGGKKRREMNHSLHPWRADGKDRNVNTFVQTCGSTERRVMDCVAGRGFTGKPSKQISDKTEHPVSMGESGLETVLH